MALFLYLQQFFLRRLAEKRDIRHRFYTGWKANSVSCIGTAAQKNGEPHEIVYAKATRRAAREPTDKRGSPPRSEDQSTRPGVLPRKHPLQCNGISGFLVDQRRAACRDSLLLRLSKFSVRQRTSRFKRTNQEPSRVERHSPVGSKCPRSSSRTRPLHVIQVHNKDVVVMAVMAQRSGSVL